MRSPSLPLPQTLLLSSSSSNFSPSSSSSLLSPSSPSSIASRTRKRRTSNLRNRRLCANLLKSLPSDLESLWIGPSFVTTEEVTVDNPAISIGSSLLKLLPPQLVHLDLDLTHTRGMRGNNETTLEDEFIKVLFTSSTLRSVEILSLRLYGNDGAAKLAKPLKNSLDLPCLETLDLRGNRIGDIGVQALSEALIERDNSTIIGCSNRRSSSSSRCSSMRNLILSWNDITCEGASTLASVLKYTRLERLDLSCNDLIADDGIRALCMSLHNNASLTELNLFCCHRITEKGARAILNCLVEHNNMTLERVNLQPTSSYDGQTLLAVEHWLALNRGGRRILRHKETLPLGLWPHILARKASPSTMCHTATSNPSELYFLLCENPQLVEEIRK